MTPGVGHGVSAVTAPLSPVGEAGLPPMPPMRNAGGGGRLAARLIRLPTVSPVARWSRLRLVLTVRAHPRPTGLTQRHTPRSPHLGRRSHVGRQACASGDSCTVCLPPPSPSPPPPSPPSPRRRRRPALRRRRRRHRHRHRRRRRARPRAGEIMSYRETGGVYGLIYNIRTGTGSNQGRR